jgi:hypothetical protein
MSEEFTNPEIIKTLPHIIHSLLLKKVFSPLRENVIIERIDREPIYPCRRYGPEGLDLDQLEWAANEGHFWFSGPIRAIKIIFDKDPMQGDLILEINKITFITSLNTLNYQNFEAVIRKIKDAALQLGLTLDFQGITNYDVKLTASSTTFLSVDNVNDFVNKLQSVHAIE